MKYGKSLYQDTDVYICHRYKNRAEWLEGRHTLNGIGGSDAAATIGLSPWKSNLDLWREKTGRKTAPDISDNRRVHDGIDEEDPIRRIFQCETQDQYEVQYEPDAILQNKEHPFMLYSPDGLLIDKETGLHGILEIKTTEISKSWKNEQWGTKDEPRIPDNYFCQVLHGINVTGFSFVVLYARLKYPDGSLIFRQPNTYRINAEDKRDDLEFLKNGVEEFWQHVLENKEPGLILPEI